MDDIATQIASLKQGLATLEAAMGGQPDQPCRFVKFDMEQRLVYAEVYLPDVPDAHGDQMSRDEIQKMAHNFMKTARTTMIDVNHDNKVDYGCYMVESFIARDSDPDYAAGAWVGVIKVANDEIWTAIKSGEITGFSFEGVGYVTDDPI